MSIRCGEKTLARGRGGTPPRPEVIPASRKRARQEMVQRLREKKSNEGPGRGQGEGNDKSEARQDACGLA